ncbi:MAG: hypothetical protein ACJAS9_003662 [Polaribacter sp.]|jgi:hypothetical protein
MKFFLKVKGDVFQFRNLIRLKIVSYVFNGNKLVFKLIELLYVCLNCRYYLLIKRTTPASYITVKELVAEGVIEM